MQIEDIVSGWLNGSEDMNPAGPLYIEGVASTEAALTDTSLPLLTRCSSCSGSAAARWCRSARPRWRRRLRCTADPPGSCLPNR